MANNDESQKKLNKVNNVYFKAITTQIRKAEKEGKVTNVLSIRDLRNLNQTFRRNLYMAENIQSVNNLYFKALTTQIQKAENEGKKITDVLSISNLRYLNETFSSDSNMAETIQSVNNAYFKVITTQIQKTENEGKKITDVLSAYDLKYLNSLYKQENKPESLNALNITYLTTLLAQNIEDICDEDDLEILNLVFQRSQDQQIQDLLRQINAKMESAQG